MSSKNIGLKNGPRFNPINQRLWKDFCDQNDIEYIDLPYPLFVEIIYKSNEKICKKLVDNVEGFKFPEELGYGVITRYRPKKESRRIDWKKTKETGVRVYHTNFHSHGYKPRINWLTDGLSKCRYIEIYKFVAGRKLVRSNTAEIFNGKLYNEFSYDHFKQRKIRVNLNKIR